MYFYIFAYWHSAQFKKRVGGPIKVYELATNLTQRGHKVFLFIPKIGYPERQTSANVCAVPLIDLPLLRFISFQIMACLMALISLVQKGRPDVFYVRIMWSFLPMLLAKFFSIPVILEVNDSPHRGYDNIIHSVKRRFVHLTDRISYRLSDHVLPVTQKIASDLHHIDDLSWKRMTVFQSGANTDLFRPLRKSLCCQSLGLDCKKKYVGFIGTFFRHQGIDILIDSAPEIIEACPDVLFLLVGDGPQRKTWENRANQMDLQDRFIFTGHIAYKDVPCYCGVMNVCVSPLLQEARESSAVKIFDYLACGKPVVLSDISDTGKQFLASEAVLLVKPEDPAELAQAIITLLRNTKRRESMGQRGRGFVVSRYDRKKLAGDISQLCLDITNRRRSLE